MRAESGLYRWYNDYRLEGYQNADPSCRDRMVLVDQAAEEVTPSDLRHDRHRVDVAGA